MTPTVVSFFDDNTMTWSHIVHAPGERSCAVIDPVLDFDPAAGRISTANLDRLCQHVEAQGLQVQWVLDTHVHADHLSAASLVQQRLGGRLGIGAQVVQVQAIFARRFNAEAGFALDGSQFDELFSAGDHFTLGSMTARVLHTPGHTPGCVSYVFDGAAFVGDTLFAPDYGTARCDFPGGDAEALYRSIQALYALPPETRLYLCHDYLPDEGRDQHQAFATVAEQRTSNVHCRAETTPSAFVALREERDQQLATPRLLLPSVQFNMRGARLPPAEGNGSHYLKWPVSLPEGVDLSSD